jgi:hypothetical protein
MTRWFFTRAPSRRDGMALGFGLAFLVFGVLGLLHVSGAGVPASWLYPTILLGLGAAGLLSLISKKPR